MLWIMARLGQLAADSLHECWLYVVERKTRLDAMQLHGS
jgi:hypothetical protein